MKPRPIKLEAKKVVRPSAGTRRRRVRGSRERGLAPESGRARLIRMALLGAAFMAAVIAAIVL
jgi:hypothetical protein